MRAMFFGDSMTYGHGLPDCILPIRTGEMLAAGSEPSKFSWAQLTADALGLPCHNMSIPGSSNLQIHWVLRHAGITRDDLVFVEWSYPSRHCLLEKEVIQIGSWMDEKIAESYYLMHSDEDIDNRNLLIIEHTALLLDRIGVKWMFFAHYIEDIPASLRYTIVDCFETYQCDVAMDGNHPGMESNRIWAEIVTKHANNRLTGGPWSHDLKI